MMLVREFYEGALNSIKNWLRKGADIGKGVREFVEEAFSKATRGISAEAAENTSEKILKEAAENATKTMDETVEGVAKFSNEAIEAITKSSDEIVSDILNKYNLTSIEDVWTMKPTERGKVLEEIAAQTDYKDWWNCGAELGGTFPVVDFQNGLDVVSFKSIDPTLPSYANGRADKKIIEYIDNLNLDIKVDGVSANKTLDVVVPKDTIDLINVGSLTEYAGDYHISLSIREY